MMQQAAPNPNANPNPHYGPHRYEVRHRTTYRYDADVNVSLARAILRTRPTSYQQVSDEVIEIDPEPTLIEQHVDFFGNLSHYVEIRTPHQVLDVYKRCVAEVDMPLQDLSELRISVADAVDALQDDPDVDATEVGIFTLPSDLVSLAPVVQEFAATLLWPKRPLGEAIADVYRTIFRDFKYDKHATNVRTTLPEVIVKQAGVCQDFAHLAIACFRAVGLPARYVSGYIETYPPLGKPKLAGSDATHAWASVLVPGKGWVDLDPTNNHLADSRYITSAWGRDFSDVSPLKGVIFSESKHSELKVGVDVSRLDTPQT